ncbi:MAG: polyphosphate kinase 2 family protein [Bacteroidetes bacterium]|nr:polyphosphate kinase 2 family protein [Bacteroidota bacterium]
MKHSGLIYKPGSQKRLDEFATESTGNFKSKNSADKILAKSIEELSKLQDLLYAQDSYSLLIIFQAMDAAGKDGTIKHVMSGINPQGCQVYSFKAPSAEELNHDFLWRCNYRLPERGKIGIFNRSYYEEVLVTRVHPSLLDLQKLPGWPLNEDKMDEFWEERFNDINNFEKHLKNNGTIILKFFLNVSAEEQKQRLLRRIDDPSRNWKFNTGDLEERVLWNRYMLAYEEMLKHTSTKTAPWFVIPADKKWFMRTAVSNIIVETLKSLNLSYPEIDKKQKSDLNRAKVILEKEFGK